jgi:hypothetical protein
MNQQPLENYGSESLYGCGLKLLNRSYTGPLVRLVRHNDGTEVDVYPDSDGYIAAGSYVDVVSGDSSASLLSTFLCTDGCDDVLGGPTSVTAGIAIMYDQGSSINNLVNEDTATQPLLCEAGSVFVSDWGWAASFSGGRYFETNTIQSEVTFHFRLQILDTLGTKYLFRQLDNAVYAKVTDQYLDEAVGLDAAVVFLDENYYRDYTTYDINLTANEGALLSLEVTASDLLLSDPPTYRIENIDLLQTVIMYEGVGAHARRHATNIQLAEDKVDLQAKLQKFNPQSYYNFVAGAKAIYGTFSFAGVLGPLNTRMMRIRRKVGVVTQYIDVFTDNTGYITLDSPVDNSSSGSTATVLGEWVNHSEYDNPDGITPVDAYIDRLYSQVNESVDLVGNASAPKLYTAATETLSSAGANGVVGLDFYVPEDDDPTKSLSLAEKFYAKTVVVVYANKDSTLETNGLVSAQYGPTIYSKFAFSGFGTHGVTVYDQTNFNFTQEGIDSDVHVVCLFEDAQKLVVDNVEYDINYDKIPDGIEDTEYEDSTMWSTVGALSGFGSSPHKGYIAAVIFYDDDKYDQRDFIHSYMNTLFGIQNTPFPEPVTYPEITGYQTLELPLTGSGDVEVTYARAPQGIVPGELLLLVGAYNTTGDVKIPYAPYGWELYNNGDFMVSGLAGVGITLMYKIADGTEEEYPEIGVLSTAPTDEAIFWYIRIRNGSTNFFVGDGAFNTSSDVIVAPSVDTTGYTTPLALAFMATSTGAGVLINTIGSDPGWSDDQGPLSFPEYNVDGVSGAFAFNTVDGNSSGNASFDYLVDEEFVSGIAARQIVIPYAPAIAPLPAKRTLLDDYSGAAVAYSLREVGSGYTGPAVRVRRTLDDAEQDFGFDSLGVVNTGEIELFCGSSDGYVVIWYDQSGNSNDAVQATTASQPKIYDSSTGVVLQNGKPALDYISNDWLESANFASQINAPNFFSAVVTFDATSNMYFVDSDSPGRSATGIISGNYSIRGLNGGTAATGQHLVSVSQEAAGAYMYVNTVQKISGGTSNLVTHTNVLVGDDSLYLNGKMQELVLYPSDQSANRAGIEENINAHYSIYEPPRLLNTYSGSAAAYSLRKLNADYTGAAIRVRRASDNTEADIGFISNGDLNTSVLRAFCINTDGYVSVWYDQSGNGNDAVQATTSAQPQIVASGSVITKNSLPTLRFASDSLRTSSQITTGTTARHVCIIGVSDNATTNASMLEIASYGGGDGTDMRFTAEIAVRVAGAAIYGSNFQGSDLKIMSWALPDASDVFDASLYLNGASVSRTGGSDATIDTGDGGYSTIGLSEAASTSYTGYLSSVIVWNSDQSANRAGIESDINEYYSIYEEPKLLDTYGGSAASYSLRHLNSAYDGPAIRVRRDTDNTELDIAFYEGELDTVTLIDFCLNANGYVSVWYDQSGNGNDAVQATTSAQPQIVASGSVLVDSSGKAVVSFDGGDDYLQTSYNAPITFTAFWSQIPTDLDSGQILGKGTSGRYVMAWSSSNQIILYRNGSVSLNETNTPAHYLGYLLSTSPDTACVIGYNGSVKTGVNAIGSDTLSQMVIGAERSSVSIYGNSDLQEIILYPSDKSSDRTGIEANINRHYSIYDPNPPVPAGPPVVEAYEISKQTTTSSSAVVTLTAPSGIQAGELLLMMTFNDAPFDGAVYDTPTGWTKIYEVGGSSPDTYGAAFYKVADGNEGSSQDITYSAPSIENNNISWYLRLSSVDTDNPIEGVGTVFNASFSNVVTATDVTTTSDNCLAFAVSAFDGGDGYPVGISGTGWPTSIPAGQSDYHSDTGSSSLTASWVTKEVLTAGDTSNVNFTYSTSDSTFALQFAIKGT